MKRTITIKISDIEQVMQRFTREELRATARAYNVRRGRDKADTLRNLMAANVPVNVTVDTNCVKVDTVRWKNNAS